MRLARILGIAYAGTSHVILSKSEDEKVTLKSRTNYKARYTTPDTLFYPAQEYLRRDY